MSQAETLPIPGLEPQEPKAGVQGASVLSDEERSKIKETARRRNSINILPAIDRLQDGEMTFSEAVEVIADQHQEEWQRRQDAHRESAYADSGYHDRDRPEELGISKQDFLHLIEIEHGRDAFFWEIQDPDTHRQHFLALLPQVESLEHKSAEEKPAYEAKLKEKILEQTGLETLEAFQALLYVTQHFDTTRPVIPEN